MNSYKKIKYEVNQIEEIVKNNHIYLLVKIKMPKISSNRRNKILDQIMEREKLIMIVELWDKGNVIVRPREEVYYIFVKKINSIKSSAKH